MRPHLHPNGRPPSWVRPTLLLAFFASSCLPPGRRTRSSLPPPVEDLPLVELPVAGATPTMAFVLSGDGNWASFIRELADSLVREGVPVVGLKSRAYLSTPKRPEELGRDMERVLDYYSREWNAQHIVVVGYSRGADLAPFMVNRISPALRSRIRTVALLSPSRMVNFEFHPMDLLKYTPRDSDVAVIPEVNALHMDVVCVYGVRDDQTLCPLLPDGLADVVSQDAGHRLHEPGRLASIVLAIRE